MNNSAGSIGIVMSEELNLKLLQVKFLKVVGKWVTGKENLQTPTLDIPDIVFILQALGFTINRMDACHPLRPGELGNRATITCLHSGNRFFLELPQPSRAECKCSFKIDQDDRDSFWEVTAAGNKQGETIIETELLPKIPKEIYTLANNVLKTLIHMANGTLEAESSINSMNSSTNSLYSSTSQAATSSPQVNARRLSGFLADLGVAPSILVSSPQNAVDAPRYHSLDMLNKDPKENITPKTPLRASLKQSDVTQSSPNIYLGAPGPGSSVGSSVSTIGDTRVTRVTKLLVEALSVLNGKEVINVSQIFKNSQTDVSSKSSTRSTITKKTNSTATKIKNQSVKKAVTSAKSTVTSKIASAKKTSNTIGLTKKQPESVVKDSKVTTKDSNKEKLPTNRPSISKTLPKSITKDNLYSHVKSTIPKANSVKKL